MKASKFFEVTLCMVLAFHKGSFCANIPEDINAASNDLERSEETLATELRDMSNPRVSEDSMSDSMYRTTRFDPNDDEQSRQMAHMIRESLKRLMSQGNLPKVDLDQYKRKLDLLQPDMTYNPRAIPYLFRKRNGGKEENEKGTLPYLFRKNWASLFRKNVDDDDDNVGDRALFSKNWSSLFRRDEGERSGMPYLFRKNLDTFVREMAQEQMEDGNESPEVKGYDFTSLFKRTNVVPFLFRRSADDKSQVPFLFRRAGATVPFLFRKSPEMMSLFRDVIPDDVILDYIKQEKSNEIN